MNIIRAMILLLAIIVKWENFCFCKEYHLKSVEDVDMKLDRLQNRQSTWDLLSKIFQSKGSATVIVKNFEMKEVKWHDSFIGLLQMKLGLSVTVVEVTEGTERSSIADGTNPYTGNIATEYILMMDDMRMYSHFLKVAVTNFRNRKSKTGSLIITCGKNVDSVREVFRFMWTTYGFGRAISINIETGEAIAYNYLKDTTTLFDISNMKKTFLIYSPYNKLDGYPIRVTMVHNPPTAIARPNSTRFDGVDGLMMDTLETYMNFTLVMCKPRFRDEFGNITSTGPYEDTTGRVARREIDIDGNMRFMTSLNDNVGERLEFTSPFFSDRIQFLVPKPEKVALWLSPWRIFDKKIWIPTTCLFAILIVSWLCISKFYHDSHIGLDHGSMICINVLFLLTGQPVSSHLNKFAVKLLVISGSIFAVIMVSCFTGHLFLRFSEVVYHAGIDTLEKLEKSGLPLFRGSYGVVNTIKGNEDPVLQRLLEIIDRKNDLATVYDTENGVLDRAVLSQLTRIRYEIAHSVIMNNGTESLHMMEKSLGRYSMGYVIPRGWFFSRHFNSRIQRILESGLIQKWYYNSTFLITYRMHRAKYESSEELPRPFRLSDLRLAWFILSIGLPISLVTFLIEIAWHSQLKRKVIKYVRGILNN